MKKKILIGLLLLCVLLSGCTFLDRTVCIEHSNINFTRLDQRTWEVPNGTFEFHIYMCEKENETEG